MARETEPLLARRPSSHDSGRAEEEDALLSGQTQQETGFFGRFSDEQWRRFRETFAFLWAFLATIGIIILAVLLQHRAAAPGGGPHHRHSGSKPGKHHSDGQDSLHNARPSGKRNLIFMVSDGMGPASLSLTRSFDQYTRAGAPFNSTLLLDSLLIGQSRTRSSNSLVTDSAAGATAFSCGAKSYNGAISVLPDGTPCASVMEAAKRAGYVTGVVVTTRVTDATPACFGAHVLKREYEDDIALQLVGLEGVGSLNGTKSMDLILGGGRCHFQPAGGLDGGCRADSRDLVAEARDDGWNWAGSRADFDGLKGGKGVELPLLGLFAQGDIPFEIDRRFQKSTFPALAEMAKVALRALKEASRHSEKGFFLMIEGSRIDHAGHINDPAAQVHEVLAYDRAIQAVVDFISAEDEDEEHGVPTLMVGTSDHETGGLSVARQLIPTVYPAYGWHPSVLANATNSAQWAAARLHEHLGDDSPNESSALVPAARKEDTASFLRDLVRSHLGFAPSEAEVAAVLDRPVFAIWILADMISRRARIGWASHGHSAVDVNIYSSASVGGARFNGTHTRWAHAVRERLAGNRENTDVGRFLRWWLDVEEEFDDVGEELREGHRGGAMTRVDEVGKGGNTPNHRLFEGADVEAYERWSAGRDWS